MALIGRWANIHLLGTDLSVRIDLYDHKTCGPAFRAALEENMTPTTHPVFELSSAERKATPITAGVLDYFPNALAAVAQVSKAGNDKHNPGQPLHWSRNKSADHADSIARHLVDRGAIDPEDGQRHSAHLAWRALALLEEELLADGATPGRRASKDPVPGSVVEVDRALALATNAGNFNRDYSKRDGNGWTH